MTRLQTFQRPPALLLVDELDSFAYPAEHPGCGQELHAARCCACILNAALACSRLAQSRSVQICATSREPRDVYRLYFDNRWSLEAAQQDERRVWMRSENRTRALEFRRLDDAVLVLRSVLEAREEEEVGA